MKPKTMIFIGAAVSLGVIVGLVTLRTFSVQQEQEDRRDPQKTTQLFLEAMKNEDYGRAKQFATTQTENALDAIENMAELDGGITALAGGSHSSIDEIRCDGSADYKTCYVCCGEKGGVGVVHLNRNSDGLWEVDMTKEKLTKNEPDIEEMPEID